MGNSSDMPPSKQKRKRLSAVERDAFVEEIARILISRPQVDSRVATVEAMNKVLPPEKRMDYNQTRISWKWLKQEVSKRLELLKKLAEPTPNPQPIEPEIIELDITTVSTDDLIKELVSRFLAGTTQVLEKTIRDALVPLKPTTSIEINPPTKIEPKIRKLRVGVVGLQAGRSEAIIRKEFGSDIDLKFFSNYNQSASHLSGQDYVVGMTDFMAHKIQNSILKHVGNNRYIKLSGGISQLKSQLTELYVKFSEQHETQG